MMTLPYRVMVVSWLSVLAAAVVPVLRFSYKQARALIVSGTMDMCSWSCAVPRIPSWLPRRLSTLWQSEVVDDLTV